MSTTCEGDLVLPFGLRACMRDRVRLPGCCPHLDEKYGIQPPKINPSDETSVQPYIACVTLTEGRVLS